MSTTLEEELIDAAENAALLGYHFRGAGALDLEERQKAREGRLRVRAAWARQARDNIAEVGIVGPGTAGAEEMFRSLTGPIPEGFKEPFAIGKVWARQFSRFFWQSES